MFVAVDECSLGTHECSPNADCIDTPNSYDCVCLPGYYGDGFRCTGQSVSAQNNLKNEHTLMQYK